MNEKLKKPLSELCKAVLLALAGFLTAVFTVSCGSTRAVVTNNATATTTEIKITTNNPTSVDVSPNVTYNGKEK